MDCSKFIWIVATNYGESLIERFHEKEVQHLNDAVRDNVNLAPLQDQLVESYTAKFGARITITQ
jgi:hypothetical protein